MMPCVEQLVTLQATHIARSARAFCPRMHSIRRDVTFWVFRWISSRKYRGLGSLEIFCKAILATAGCNWSSRMMSMKGVVDATGNLAKRAKLMRGGRWLRVVILLLARLLLLNLCEARPYALTSPCRRRLLSRDVIESTPSSVRSISLKMLHRDHEESPLRRSQAHSLSFSQRMKEATLRSRQYTQSIKQKIPMPVDGSNSSTARTQILEVRSPVFAQQGEFIASINLGTPVEKFVMILDSGSDLVWVQCKPCRACIANMPHPLFDPSNSSSYNKLPCASDFCKALPYSSPVCHGDTCRFVLHYGDGTTTAGEFATETVTFELTSGSTVKIPDFAFGCGIANSGDLAGSDGILGIGKGPFSLPSQLSQLVGNKFSFCLVSIYEATAKTSPFVLGHGPFVQASGSRWTPILSNDQTPSFYYVQIDGIKVHGKSLRGIPSSTFTIDSITGNDGTIVDTGTTLTELLAPAYDALVSKVSNTVPYPRVDGSDFGLDLCWDTSNAPQPGPVFPSISFKFRWEDFDLPPDSAYIEVYSNIFCLSFTSGDGMNIIGNLHMQNLHIFVNNDDNMLGWKPAVCA